MNARSSHSSRSPVPITQRLVDAQEKSVVITYVRQRRLLDIVTVAARRADALARLDLALTLQSYDV